MTMTPLLNLSLGILVCAVVAWLYLLPMGVALRRKHNNIAPLAFLNIFLGWTLLFWVITLFWSFAGKRNA